MSDTPNAESVSVTRYRNKTYIKVPGGEVQVGHVSGSVVAWIDGVKHTLRPAQIDGSGGER